VTDALETSTPPPSRRLDRKLAGIAASRYHRTTS
jgi:hypothetical protein